MHNKKVVFISGSSSGIGYDLAKKYKLLGHTLIINGTKEAKLKKASLSLGCDYFLGDLTEKKQVNLLVDNLKKKYNYLDVLICNLGNSKYKRNNKDYLHAFKYNFYPTVNLVENSKNILKKGKSKIICISSICGLETIEGAPIGYSIAKSALNFYIKLISKELAEIQVSINGIIPGNIYFTGSTWDIKMKDNPKKIKKYIKHNVPMNKFGSTQNIFEVCKMLTENTDNFITGSLFKLDGGQTKSV